MMIPFVDLHSQHQEINREIKAAIDRTIKRSDFILGEDVSAFEKEFAGFCGAAYAVGVSSGTAALFLALKCLRIGDGDEVIVPVFTYIATALAVSYTGAKPVFVDIEEDTYNIDPSKIKRAVTRKTKAVIPVHLYGQPADMPQILRLARTYNLKVVEDAAQAHGASIKMGHSKWQKAGSLADIGCFSFYPTKNLGALGDGGIITTSSEESFKKLLSLRDYGRISRYEHTTIGYNSRLDTLQAAILRPKLKRLDAWNKMRQRNALIYNRFLKDTGAIITPYASPSARHIYHVYAVRAKKRDELCKRLKAKNINTLIHYPLPLHLQKAYAYLGYKKGDFPIAERVSQEILSLPMYPHLKEGQIKFIADAITCILK